MIRTFVKIIKKVFWRSNLKTSRLDGISICVRLNDERFIPILDIQFAWIHEMIDEIVIHFNSIKNKQLLNDLRNKYPKIKIFEYDYDHRNFSFTDYSNDFIKRINHKWLFVWDSDVLFEKTILQSLLSKIKKSQYNYVYVFSGINLFPSNSSFDKSTEYKFYNLDSKPVFPAIVGLGDFVCFVPNEKELIWGNERIVIDMSWRIRKFSGISFLHVGRFNQNTWLSKATLSRDFDLDLINKNLNNLPDKFHINYYKKIIRKTSSKNCQKLIECTEMLYHDN